MRRFGYPIKSLLGWFWLGLLGVGSAQGQLPELRESLIRRLGIERSEFPPVVHAPDLQANARYARDTIWLGKVQREFQSRGDTLSLLYHEYIHHRLQGRYSVHCDSFGQPVQWMTDQQYHYQPSALQIEKELAQTQGFFDRLPAAQREQQLQRLRRDLTQPRLRVLRYAPSNLAREEIEAYRQQLAGEQAGLYQLSSSARTAIRIRLYQLDSTLRERMLYEQTHGLDPAGKPLQERTHQR